MIPAEYSYMLYERVNCAKNQNNLASINYGALCLSETPTEILASTSGRALDRRLHSPWSMGSSSMPEVARSIFIDAHPEMWISNPIH
ncbi:hypothetical protein ACTXT7_008850 [Hymenolepis weldensis]